MHISWQNLSIYPLFIFPKVIPELRIQWCTDTISLLCPMSLVGTIHYFLIQSNFLTLVHWVPEYPRNQDAHYFHLQLHLFLPLGCFSRIVHTLDFLGRDKVRLILCVLHSSVNLSSSHWIRGEKTNHRHSIWTIFPKIYFKISDYL